MIQIRPKCGLCYWIMSLVALLMSACGSDGSSPFSAQEPIDKVNPLMGNISHLLVPTYPTVHLPNSMLRITPERSSYTDEQIKGLPLILVSHRGLSAFRISPSSHPLDSTDAIRSYIYDGERITPYRYSVRLPEEDILVDFAPSRQSALYYLSFEKEDAEPSLVFTASGGRLEVSGKVVQGYQPMVGGDSLRNVYIYAEFSDAPTTYALRDEQTGAVIGQDASSAQGETLVLGWKPGQEELYIRYGISFISQAQAKRNVEREIQTYEINMVAKSAREAWNRALALIEVEGGTPQEQSVFYTSLYRTYERMVNISEEGRYFSGIDAQVHEDEGVPFYTDDWIWDTYLAVHPLRILLAPQTEQAILTSYLRMTEQSKEGWLPTFPEVYGDTHRMNGMHTIATFADAYAKGLTGFDLAKAYEYSQRTMSEKSYLPWTRMPKTRLDHHLDEYGYMPALREGEQETVPSVTKWEKRQAVAVSLAAAYDYWCLSQMALQLGRDDEADSYLQRSYDYRSLFNSQTHFFHPKGEDRIFIKPFDYELSGGLGARDYYDENNGYTYRWDVKHNPADLIYLMGGKQLFIQRLDETFRTPLSKSKWEFYSQLPDQTGNVGQFSMGNEPSMHIPYLYNYAGAAWRTQRAVRRLLASWFRSDLMGVPGDEDGGGLSAFVVFSMMGFYPTTPGMPIYNIGSPVFNKVTLHLPSSAKFTIIAEDASSDNVYIQSAKLNGRALERAWLKHSEIIEGGTLEFKMGPKPNKSWGSQLPPPSAKAMERGDKK